MVQGITIALFNTVNIKLIYQRLKSISLLHLNTIKEIYFQTSPGVINLRDTNVKFVHFALLQNGKKIRIDKD